MGSSKSDPGTSFLLLRFTRAFPALWFLFWAQFHAFGQSHTVWADYGGAADAAQYSALKQINRSNVNKLKVAWLYPTGDNNKYFFNPIVVDGLMYVLAKKNSIVALDATSGKEIWTYASDPDTKVITNRGINYWESQDRSDRRLLFASNHFLRAIDARTGKPVLSFGTAGRVDLKQGLGRDPKNIALVQSTTPGRVFENLLILGSATNQGYGSAPGDIRAFDVRSGELVWTFHTIPHPGEFGYETWPKDAWKTVGGANVWGEFSVDEKRGIVYAPTASAKYNFYGADRTGANLFADCLLALDARTGKRLWHFQMVHHDIWDYDDATAPKLLTVRHDGKTVDAVAQVSKQGFVWVFNRVTGEPLWPIEERLVPKSDMPGETTWPTQPFPLKPPPFARQKFTVEDLSPFLDPQERARFKDQILSARNEGLFTPPGLRNTIQMPGNNGGANWSGAAVDPTNGTLYVVSKDLPAMLKLAPGENKKAAPADSGQQAAQSIASRESEGAHYFSGFGFMIASSGLSPIAPPWSSLTVYDLNDGTIKWKIPLGEVPELAAKGFKDTGSHYPKVGPVVTAGGLIFTGTRDRKIRAFDVDTGKVLWETEVESALEGIPAVYEINGRQYIAFCASAQVGLTPATQGKIHGAYVAFALPSAEGDSRTQSSSPGTSPSWNAKAAAAYLDGRIGWWMDWPSAARDHDTFCVSCHTAVPYAMARPALRTALAEQSPSALERKLLDNVTKRVRMWKEVQPFYPDETRGVPKTAESRGTESILNAVILAGYDVPRGKLSPDARLALDNMWAEQLQSGEAKGAWAWLQFHNSPWEGDSQYYGATLAAIAVGTAPGDYRSAASIQKGMNLLREYLLRERDSQVLINRVMLLWASTKLLGLLTPAQQKSIVDEALSKQQADGGYSLSSFVGDWKRRDDTPLDPRSDGYATGVVTLVLQEAGLTPDQASLKRSLSWLRLNQDKTEGRWLAYSLNKQRDLSTDVGRFMSDAATAYAVLALQRAH